MMTGKPKRLNECQLSKYTSKHGKVQLSLTVKIHTWINYKVSCEVTSYALFHLQEIQTIGTNVGYTTE